MFYEPGVNPDIAWDVSLGKLDEHLRRAGIEPVRREGISSVRDLDAPTREALIESLRASVRRARMDAPPVNKWLAASESLVLNDDGSEAALQKADAFWLRLTHIVAGCQALAMLGDVSEFPFFIELLKHQPAGHLAELAADVLRRTVDPSHELDTPHLIRQAEDWWNSP
jgi:sugar phosphate isomerase/epimerase